MTDKRTLAKNAIISHLQANDTVRQADLLSAIVCEEFKNTTVRRALDDLMADGTIIKNKENNSVTYRLITIKKEEPEKVSRIITEIKPIPADTEINHIVPDPEIDSFMNEEKKKFDKMKFSIIKEFEINDLSFIMTLEPAFIYSLHKSKGYKSTDIQTVINDLVNDGTILRKTNKANQSYICLKKQKPAHVFENIENHIIDDILETPDEEIIQEAIEDGVDVDQVVSEVKEMIEKTKEKVKRQKPIRMKYSDFTLTEILELLRNNSPLSVKNISDSLGFSMLKTRMALIKLKKKGSVIETKKDKKYYELRR